MRKTREEKAITLIALIITIVVLLILAVVAINAVTGDGIIQHAVNAKTQYENAQAKEQGMISYYQAYLESEGQVGRWKQDKTKVTRVNQDGIVDELEVGDLISNYKSTKNEAIQWKVLGAKDGKILLASATDVGRQDLRGKEGYLNGVTYLNTVASGYDDGIGAIAGSSRSITLDDIDRVTGYNPLKTLDGKIVNEDEVNQYLSEVTYTLTEDGKVSYSSSISSQSASGVSSQTRFVSLDETQLVKTSAYTGQEKTAKSLTFKNTNREAYIATSLTQDINNTQINGLRKETEAYKLLFPTKESETKTNYYWVATPVINTLKGYVCWGMSEVFEGWVGGDGLYYSHTATVYGHEEGVRAVVTLKDNVKFTKTAEHTYTIAEINS